MRAPMEGIALNLRLSLQYLKEKVELSDEIIFCGGGSRSPFWMQMFADVFDMLIQKGEIDQDAASLGAAREYDKLFNVFTHVNETAAELGDYMQAAKRKVDIDG